MKKLLFTVLILAAGAQSAQASIGGRFQCGTVALTIAFDGKAGLVTEKGETSYFIECQNVSGQQGWNPGTVLVCNGEGYGQQADGSCTPVYLVTTYGNGTVDISKDTISCHSCADYEPVYTGLCK